MAKKWYFETLLSSKHTLYIYPNTEITFGRWGTKFRFGDARIFGKVHGMDDYGVPILHQWFEMGFYCTIEKMYYLRDKSRVVVDDYGTMLYAR